MTSAIAINIDSVWKKFRKGEKYDSLRDLIPGAIKRLYQNNHNAQLGDREFWALQDVSFTVKQGEVLGIIGSNGSGKSTILKLLSKILKPNKGRVEANGRLSALIEVGAGFHPDLTGRENIYLNAAILGMRKDEINKKFDLIVEFSGLHEFIDTPVKRYSSGMYARLGFSVAAHIEPEILLVDEVLAVGDVTFQRRCLGKMNNVAQEGRTIIFVSHNMAAIKQLCGRVVWLEHGVLRGDGTADEIIPGYLGAMAGDAESGIVKSHMRQGGSGELAIRQVGIRNSSGEDANEIMMGEEWEVVLRFDVFQPVHGVAMVVGISTLDGIRITTLDQSAYEVEPVFLRSGSFEISVRLTNFLLPGSYALDVAALASLGGGAFHYVLHARNFSVSEVAQQDHDLVPITSNYKRGFIRVLSKWSSPRSVRADLVSDSHQSQ